MALEAGTWITDLVPTNPPSGDPKSQGDDHLRLLKSVLQACFPVASKAWYNPRSLVKSADFTVTAAQMNMLFYVTTASATVTATLPALASGDDGWTCYFVKTNTGTNPLFIAPASGTLQSGEVPSLAKCRRVIPGHICKAVWNGSAWFVTRNCSAPIGGYIEGQWATMPVGFELPNGQTLASASTNYPEFYAVNGNSGITLDLTGRATAMKEAIETRITTAGAGFTGATLGAGGGAQTVTLTQANLPNVTLTVSPTGGSISASTSVGSGQGQDGFGTNITRRDNTNSLGAPAIAVSDTRTWATASINTGITQTVVNKMPPLIIVNKVLVVE